MSVFFYLFVLLLTNVNYSYLKYYYSMWNIWRQNVESVVPAILIRFSYYAVKKEIEFNIFLWNEWSMSSNGKCLSITYYIRKD